MSISFSGLSSGLDTSSWVEALVSVKQKQLSTIQNELKTVQNKKATLTSTRSTFSSLRTAIEKLTDKKFGGTFDLFSKNTAESTNEDIFTATASSTALRQNYNISVEQLATATKATSVTSASSIADGGTLLSALGITEGTLTTYIDGRKQQFTITENETLGTFLSELSASGIQATVESDGTLTIADSTLLGDNVTLGSTTDTSNFMSLLGMELQDDGKYHSSNSLYKASSITKLTASDAGFNDIITEGTFTIGNAEFTINSNTTLAGLISQINNNEEAQVQAFWDNTTGKLTFTSTKEGASYINIEAGTSNFTDVMGLTDHSRMLTSAQTLGKNAMFTINGTNMTSTSNTVSSDISRIEGVTLTLKGVNDADSGETTLKISQNTTDLIDAVKNFVSAYNETISKIDEVTGKGADFQRESSLTSFKSTIRNYANGRNTMNGGAFGMLSEIGISTAKADGSNLSTDTNTLTLDEDALKQALETDPSSVAAILAGENGVLSMMESAVETTLKASSGFFDVKQRTLDSDIKKYESKIKRQQTKVSDYKSQLEAKFKGMEEIIAQMQQNYSSFLG